ncbi:MAG: cbb3-type cytochrome oxidase assembly protein CcoS [Bacteroidetes bacterium]|nr:cbb3-type cytochrome oxidase assembly protein CcoS [Bacteroidota bacterium]
MQIMFVLIGFSLLVALTFLGLYLWAVRSGQFDDKYTPSVRMLFDDNTRKDTGKDAKHSENEDSEERTNTGDRSNGS